MKAVIVLTRAYKTELFEQKCKTGISCISCSCFESLSFQSSDAIECQPTDSIDNRRNVLDMANTRYVWRSLSVPISIKQNYDKYIRIVLRAGVARNI